MAFQPSVQAGIEQGITRPAVHARVELKHVLGAHERTLSSHLDLGIGRKAIVVAGGGSGGGQAFLFFEDNGFAVDVAEAECVIAGAKRRARALRTGRRALGQLGRRGCGHLDVCCGEVVWLDGRVLVLLLGRDIAGGERRGGGSVAGQLVYGKLAVFVVVRKVVVLKVVAGVGLRRVGVAVLASRRAGVGRVLGASACGIHLALVGGLFEALRHVAVGLAGSAAADFAAALVAWKCSFTDTALTVAGQGVLSGEAVATGALVRLVAAVDLRVALQVVLADKAFTAMIALELTVAEVSLDMSTNVLLAAKLLVAAVEKASPLAIAVVLRANVALDFLSTDASVFDTGVNVESLEHGFTG